MSSPKILHDLINDAQFILVYIFSNNFVELNEAHNIIVWWKYSLADPHNDSIKPCYNYFLIQLMTNGTCMDIYNLMVSLYLKAFLFGAYISR